MLRKLFIFISVAAVFATSGCVKETYDLNKLSTKAHLSPTLAVSAVRGDISFKDLIDQNDTVVFDEDNFVRIVFKKDSVIDFKMEDYYDLTDMVNFSQPYKIGDLIIAPFSGTVNYTLNEISSNLSPGLRTLFLALDGTTNNFPLFTSINIGTKTYESFLNFEYAILSEGSIDIVLKNNLPAQLSGITVKLYNTLDNSQIGIDGIISAIDAGATGVTNIDLAGVTVRNSIKAEIILAGSPGTSTPVPIDLDDNIEITISGKDLRVTSGRIVVPVQTVESLDNNDTIEFDPGEDIKIDIIKMNAGDVSYSVKSFVPMTSNVSLVLLTALQGAVPITASINVSPNATTNGTISLDNSVIDLGSIDSHPYNMLPIENLIELSSTGNMVTFNSTDEILVDIKLHDPDFDYVKGYFGQRTETFDGGSVSLDMEEILNHISGEFHLSSPSVRLNYSNSFALPVKIDLQATGYRKTDSLNLDLDSFPLSYPSAPNERDKEGSYTIDKSNSSLPELVSMPPEKMVFSGSAIMNPDDPNTLDNYLFGNSRFIGNLEIEVPLEFRMAGFTFTDTTDNFMQNLDSDSDNPVKPEDFEFLRIDITAENGFPLGASLSMILWDSSTPLVNKYEIEADSVLKPALVDNNGKVTAPVSSATKILITRDFWSSINSADKIIFKFTLNTTDGGTRDVKIYSDYKINFKAALVLKPDIRFNLD